MNKENMHGCLIPIVTSCNVLSYVIITLQLLSNYTYIICNNSYYYIYCEQNDAGHIGYF